MRNTLTRKRWIKFVLVGAIFSALVLWQTAYWSRLIMLNQIGERSRQTISLIIQTLRGDLAKYRYLPQILGGNEKFKEALRSPVSKENLATINEELERINSIAGALDTYLMDRTGMTIAASNWASSTTFIGKNFNYRPYFKAAMEGRLGRYFALGTTSGERGYYFAYPVRDGTEILGVLVVKIQVGHHEQTWQAKDAEIIVVDKAGVIFLSSEPRWRLRTLTPLSDTTINKLKDSKRYGSRPLTPLTISPEGSAFQDDNIISITTAHSQGRPSTEQFLIEEKYMADTELRVLLLARIEEVYARVKISVATVAVFLISILFAIIAINERRRRLADRIALQEQSNSQLEMRVDERTNALTRVNIALQNEVAERKRAEDEVRKAQVTLVQTAKLAALGQMSAGLSHELNQPLAAIRTYADNAREFLDRNQLKITKSNLKGISELTERMARIIRNLRTYAREETIELRPTALKTAIDESLILLDQRIRAENSVISVNFPDEDIHVVAGDVRLQQVFVNLISNALDALQETPVKEIHITITEAGEDVIITVEDTGPGIQETEVINVFDPFYSTKDVGQGMGLGLSITIGLVDQFGGTITVHNATGGGAQFTLRLKRTPIITKATV